MQASLPAHVAHKDNIIAAYHAYCNDGTMSAWVLWSCYGLHDQQCLPQSYNKQPVLGVFEGKDVFIVDFSFPRPVMDQIIQVARTVTILDHHESAMKALDGIFDGEKVFGQFDMERAGCKMVWDYVWSYVTDLEEPPEPPALLLHVADRDLWKFDMPNTREAHAWLTLTPQDVVSYDRAITKFDEDPGLYIEGGRLLMQQQAVMIGHIIDTTKRNLRIANWSVPVINGPYNLMSEALNILAQNAPFAAGYTDGPNGRGWSLRSSKEYPDGPVNVAEIAKLFGGGGHPNAAGFKTEYSQLNWQGEPSVPAAPDDPDAPVAA